MQAQATWHRQTREQLAIVHRNACACSSSSTRCSISRASRPGACRRYYEPTDLAAAHRRARQRLPLGDREGRADARSWIARRWPSPLFVDREMWEKIVLNLLSNAFKFTFEGEIEVSAAAVAGHVELTVRDTGIGIPGGRSAPAVRALPSRRRRPGPHARGHRHRPRPCAGAGQAAWRRDCASRAMVKGSTFTVSIPLGTRAICPRNRSAQRARRPRPHGRRRPSSRRRCAGCRMPAGRGAGHQRISTSPRTPAKLRRARAHPACRRQRRHARLCAPALARATRSRRSPTAKRRWQRSRAASPTWSHRYHDAAARRLQLLRANCAQIRALRTCR